MKRLKRFLHLYWVILRAKITGTIFCDECKKYLEPDCFTYIDDIHPQISVCETCVWENTFE